MKISVVMAVYNGVHFLKEQLDSLKNQSYQIDEAIIIDDCSSDSSYDLIEQYINCNQLDKWKIIKNDKNLGYRANFKKGLEISTGDIVFLCDQDDRWHLDKIETMLAYMKSEQILSLAASFQLIDENGNKIDIKKQEGKSNNNLLSKETRDDITQVTLDDLLQSNFSQGCSMALKRSVVDKYIQCNDLSLSHDWAINLIAAIEDGCYYLDKKLIDYRIHNCNTIGLDNIVDSNQSKRNKVQERLNYLDEQRYVACFLLGLDLNKKQKQMCSQYKKYLEKRIECIVNKKIVSCMIYFIKGQYFQFGKTKTFLGDILNIMFNK